jgi:hypothetical protein
MLPSGKKSSTETLIENSIDLKPQPTLFISSKNDVQITKILFL